MAVIRVQIGDQGGEFTPETTFAEVVEKLAPAFRKSALGIEVEKVSYDLSRTIAEVSADLRSKSADTSAGLVARPVTFDDEAGKEIFWHSSAHVLAQALKRLYPHIQLEDGPVVKNGPGFFFY
ncbi:MAG: threonine--tRNA ligase, partial [Turneriella sp.]